MMRLQYRSTALLIAVAIGLSACGGSGDEDNPSLLVPPAMNAAPTVAFAQPSTGTTLVEGDTAQVTVDANDSDGAVASVRLLLDGALVREDTAAPYEWGVAGSAEDALLRNLAPGSFELTAVATDDDGAEATTTLQFAVAEGASQTIITDKAAAFRFLATAGFGGSDADLEALVDTDAADWLAAQFAMPYEPYTERVIPLLTPTGGFGQSASSRRFQEFMFWDAAIAGDDPLRQRMLFALSQILVANELGNGFAHREAYYLDQLGKNAFGNYKDILVDITYTPLMGRYLTYVNNRAGDPRTGRLPDENYAREILQLFSIGLLELQMNGEPRQVNGETVDTYDNDDIVNLARVFTGLQYDRSGAEELSGWYRPMLMNNNRHSTLEKRFLNTVIPANTNGTQTLDLALDAIFSHPNVAPFISRQLIQRFTASDPSPAYVRRVAEAFESGSFVADNDTVFGSGERGDLQATLAAILLEPSLFDDTSTTNDAVGKVREPVLRFIHWARAFKLQNVDSIEENRIRFTVDSASNGLAQRPFRSPSVFNFYRPGYVAPATESGARGLTAPEFQIVNTGSAIGYMNFMTDYIRDVTPNNGAGTFVPDYSDELALADDADALVDHLALLLTGDRISEASKSSIANAVESLAIAGNNQDRDRLARVHLAIIMFTNDPTYTVIQ